MSDEIRIKVETILQVAEVTFSVKYRGETERNEDEKGVPWKCDEWSVTLHKSEKQSITLPFFTGVGLRKRTKADETSWRLYLAGNPAKKGTLHYENAYKASAPKPSAPHPADALYCYLSDAEADDMSFSDWCDTFGYSSDSIKALNTYQTCIEIAKKLRMVFDRIAELREALDGY